MWASIVAVLGTLAGTVLGVLSQQHLDRRARAERHRDELADKVRQLLKAIVLYRELHWLLVADIRDGRAETREDRAARYRARSEVTDARDALALVTTDRDLIERAEAAAWAAIDLSDIELGPVTEGGFTPDVETALTAARDRTRATHNALVRAARAYRRR
ncbi:hypothetical protein [Streptomyces millisiae]|uniref:Protein kilB n=1 Tax=Streptomyces millisiae TaxID=3075542 RepID=A0ABU2LME2_9ACTN|nr:hypothetical protein [Streptomyces sp. DSM 44918]MDT0318759.1 hypothetical protein [Streptomyces sp. DSM 44918]